MPIYDFYCPQCKVTEEYYLARTDTIPECRHCSLFVGVDHKPLERQISAPHFKVKDSKSVTKSSSFKTKYKQQPLLPINILDEMPDGSYKITSTVKDPELLNV